VSLEMIAVDLFRSLLDNGDVPRGEVFEADKLHMLSENGRSWHMPALLNELGRVNN